MESLGLVGWFFWGMGAWDSGCRPLRSGAIYGTGYGLESPLQAGGDDI